MMSNTKKNELTEAEMNEVTGGYDFFDPNSVREATEKLRQLKQQEDARKQAEAANQTGAHAHGNGASGGW